MAYTAKIDIDKCIGCSICARICPTGTLKMDKKSKKAYNTDIFCDNAWGCIYACPTNAISITEVSANDRT